MSDEKADKETTNDVEDSKIAEVLPLIEEMVTSGTLKGRIVALPYSQHLNLNVDEHPELADEKIGASVVVIMGGIVTELPKPKEKQDKDAPVPMEGRDSVGVQMYEVAVVHGKMSKFDKVAGELKREGATSPKGLAGNIGRKKLGQEEMTRRSVAGRKSK